MKKNILIVMLTLFSGSLFAAPIIYYDLDFEDGTLGGGSAPSSSFVAATNVAGSNLDGRALQFDIDNQLIWPINGPDSPFHYVSFDFFANPGSNVTQFLDMPRILRSDVETTGRHRMEILYDFPNQTVNAYLDGVLDNSLVSITSWPTMSAPSASDIRIGNQSGPPGNSMGTFQIDNLLWIGNDTEFTPSRVSAPSTILLLTCLGILGLRISRKR